MIIRKELKKIWRPGILLALAVVGCVFYTMYLEFHIRTFPENYGDSSGRGILQVSSELVRKYGTSLSEEELAQVEASLPLLEQEADRYVRKHPIGEKYGLKTYGQYEDFYQKAVEHIKNKEGADKEEPYADAMRMENYLGSEDTDNIAGRLYATRLYVEQYHYVQEHQDIEEIPGGNTEEGQNILPVEVSEDIGSYAGQLLIWICLSVCMLLSPFCVHDRMSRVQALQYSSRHGRRIWNSQFAAVLLSAGFLTTLDLLIFSGLYARHGTSVFFPCGMYSFMFTPLGQPDWTHGTWCLALAGLCYLVSLGTAGVVFFFSRSSANYITLLFKILPLFAVLAVLCPKIIEDAFYDTNVLYRASGIAYIEGICAAGIFAAGAALSLISFRKAQKE